MPNNYGQMELPLMSSPEASPAKTFQSQEPVQDLRESVAASGLNSKDSSKRSSQNTSSSKTSQPFALADWIKFSGRSLRSGMTRNGIVYPLQPLVRLTKETASGSWPTPTASMGGANGRSPSVRNGTHGMNLAGAVRLWPTPTVHGNYNRKGVSKTSGDGLATAVKKWPTPAARDYRGANGYDTTLKKLSEGKRPHLDQLPNAVQMEEGHSISGTLNPLWVEWLMGFPTDHTALKH